MIDSPSPASAFAIALAIVAGIIATIIGVFLWGLLGLSAASAAITTATIASIGYAGLKRKVKFQDPFWVTDVQELIYVTAALSLLWHWIVLPLLNTYQSGWMHDLTFMMHTMPWIGAGLIVTGMGIATYVAAIAIHRYGKQRYGLGEYYYWFIVACTMLMLMISAGAILISSIQGSGIGIWILILAHLAGAASLWATTRLLNQHGFFPGRRMLKMKYELAEALTMPHYRIRLNTNRMSTVPVETVKQLAQVLYRIATCDERFQGRNHWALVLTKKYAPTITTEEIQKLEEIATALSSHECSHTLQYIECADLSAWVELLLNRNDIGEIVAESAAACLIEVAELNYNLHEERKAARTVAKAHAWALASATFAVLGIMLLTVVLVGAPAVWTGLVLTMDVGIPGVISFTIATIIAYMLARGVDKLVNWKKDPMIALVTIFIPCAATMAIALVHGFILSPSGTIIIILAAATLWVTQIMIKSHRMGRRYFVYEVRRIVFIGFIGSILVTQYAMRVLSDTEVPAWYMYFCMTIGIISIITSLSTLILLLKEYRFWEHEQWVFRIEEYIAEKLEASRSITVLPATTCNNSFWTRAKAAEQLEALLGALLNYVLSITTWHRTFSDRKLWSVLVLQELAPILTNRGYENIKEQTQENSTDSERDAGDRYGIQYAQPNDFIEFFRMLNEGEDYNAALTTLKRRIQERIQNPDTLAEAPLTRRQRMLNWIHEIGRSSNDKTKVRQ